MKPFCHLILNDYIFRGLLAVTLLLPCSSAWAQNEIVSFSLINADTNQPIAEFDPLADGLVVNLNALPTANLNVRANVADSEGATQSVAFSLTGATTQSQTESGAPYAMAGDSSGNYNAFAFNLGSHTLSATPYSGDSAGGNAGTTFSIDFDVVNQATGDPVVSIISPTSGASAEPPADFSITAEASDPDGSVTQVEFFVDGGSIGVDTTAPYQISFNDVAEGSYSLTAVATDNDSNTTTSAPVAVSVLVPGQGGVISGEQKKWHKTTITFDGPETSESATLNPFTDYRLDVVFTGPSNQVYTVPGYYAADGDAANTGADSGNKWRVHFAPDEVGDWSYVATFVTGSNVAVDDGAAATPTSFNGASDSFTVVDSDKTGRDFRGRGRLEYVSEHYLRFADSGEYFLKQGPDAPENLLAYEEFDGPFKTDGVSDSRIKSWSAHENDWQNGDPIWSQLDGVSGVYGKDLVGALNYLASEGLNAFSFLPFNIDGDDRNVFPYTNYNERYRMDVSRLDQWEILFEHADKLGLFLHFKTQETENDQELDGGDLGPQRKLYYRELIARFSHHLALNWNLGEEHDIWSELNDPNQTRVKAYAQYFYDNDPYRHHVVIHSYPDEKSEVYTPLLGNASKLTGASLQTSNSSFNQVHNDVKTWVENSAAAGKPWAVACDEPGDAEAALRPDNNPGNSHVNGRKNGIWGTFLAGGWGNEWYFGYQYDHSDLTCEDFRSRDAWWDYCRYALEFFENNDVPYWEMRNDNSLSSASNDYCFFKSGDTYLVYLKNGGSTNLDLTGVSGEFNVAWYDPRNGGAMQNGSVTTVLGGSSVALGTAPSSTSDDWLIMISRTKKVAYIHGDVAPNGTVPSGAAEPYDQMLITDSGSEGLSLFKTMVETEGYSIEQFYDQNTALNAAFLNGYDVIIFSLHQKHWSVAEKTALDVWLQAGGGMLIYSDSASGGLYSSVGPQNPVGQSVVNNLISQYGMEVTVDQANGTKAIRAGPSATHPIVQGRPVLEGEGVSPVAVDPNGSAVRLIPYENNPDYVVSGTPSIPHQQNLTIANPQFAALALATVGDGHVIASFDRQPMWNNGPGSDIEERDNEEILRRIIQFLAGDLRDEAASPNALIAASPLSGEAPLNVQFDGSSSTPSTGASLVSYEWDFDTDGTVDDSGASVSYAYTVAGDYTVTLTVTDDLNRTDTTTVMISAVTQEPFGNGGLSWQIPGRIEAEDFDAGGEGVAYHDDETNNQGGDARTDEGVDLEATGDVGGGFNVGWTEDGEWLEYTVNVAETGTHRAVFRVASPNSGGQLRLWVDGEDQTGTVSVSNTGAWQTYADVTTPNFALQSGESVARVEIISGNFNFNWFEVSRVTEDFDAFIASYPSLTGDDALPDSDPDGDGLASVLEQWLDLDPTAASFSKMPQVSYDNAGMHYQYTIDSSVAGTSLIFETSNNLIDWDPMPLEVAWITDDGDLRHVDAVFTPSAAPLFQRLRVE